MRSTVNINLTTRTSWTKPGISLVRYSARISGSFFSVDFIFVLFFNKMFYFYFMLISFHFLMSESGSERKFFFFRNSSFLGLQETEFNEFMLVGLGLGISSIVAIGMIIYCRRYKWDQKYKIQIL